MHTTPPTLLERLRGVPDEAAWAKWEHYSKGADAEALSWIKGQSSKDEKKDARSTAATISLPEGAVNFNMGTLIGSYEKIAGMLDEVAAIEGTKGIMLVWADFLEGVDKFGQKVQPLMKSRKGRA